MHKFRTALSVVATAAMVLGTMGVAAAAGTSASNETRGAYIMQLDESLGISPVSPSTPTFTDVSASNPYYGYIEAAYQKGFVNGITTTTFGPNDPITRAEAAKVLVEAYEGGNYTPTATSTTFTDNSTIPTALVGFVAEAQTLGLLKGFPNGSFGPEAELSTAQNTHLIAQLKSALASAAYKVTASSNDVGVGQIVTLSSTATGSVTYTVTGSNASSALVSGSSFVASASGNYTVTGTTASGMTASTKISVYGTPVSLKINLPSSIVANGASTNTVTVDVLDGNGNIVANSSDEIKLTGLGSVLSGSADVYATNGVATFTLTSGTIPGAITTITATDNTNASTVTDATATATAAAQVATSISVTAPSYLSANASGSSESYTAEVEDQTGNPMLYGTWGLTSTITGPASTDGSGTMTQTAAYYANGSANITDASFSLYDIQGQTGAISITVAGSGLTSGTGSVTAVIAGTPVALQISDNAGATISADSEDAANFGTMTVTAVDSHGYPAAWYGVANVTETSGGSSSTEVTVGSTGTFSFNGGTASAPTMSSVTENLTGTTGAAGTYTFTVADAAGSLTGNSVTLAVTAGAATKLAVTQAQYVPIASPQTTVTAQLEDAHGNAVSQSGVTVDFAVNSTSATLSATSAATNAQGVATVTLTAPYTTTGGAYKVTASSLGLASDTSALGTSVEGTVASSVQLLPLGTVSTSTDNTVQLNVYAYDQYSNGVGTPDNVTLSFSDTVGTVTGSGVSSNGDGTYNVVTSTTGAPVTVTIQPETSGPLTVTGTDISSVSQPTGTASFEISSGTLAGYVFVDASGNIYGSGTKGTMGTPLTNVSNTASFSETANVPVELWLEAVDQYGNPVVVPGTAGQTVTLVPGSGSFRESQNGVDVSTLSPANQVTIASGTTELPLWYVNGAGVTTTANFFNGDAY